MYRMFKNKIKKKSKFFAIACAVAIVIFLYVNEKYLITKEDKDDRDLKYWGKLIIVIFLIIRFFEYTMMEIPIFS